MEITEINVNISFQSTYCVYNIIYVADIRCYCCSVICILY